MRVFLFTNMAFTHIAKYSIKTNRYDLISITPHITTYHGGIMITKIGIFLNHLCQIYNFF
ncbi:hypothetical protein D3C78_1510270 [compost metagenome]